MEKINLVEILKDCPIGMELDCTMYDNLYFDSVNADYDTINCYNLIDGIKTCINFTKHGAFDYHIGAKCVIFPKGKTTWEGFVPPCQFKDGDILFVDCSDDCEDEQYKYIFILKEINHGAIHSYCHIFGKKEFRTTIAYLTDNKYPIRLATEEEKQKLFDAIKENGYKWNAETKTLEKLIPNKFDISTLKPFENVLVRHNNDNKWCGAFFSHIDEDLHSHCYKFVTTSGKSYPYCIPYGNNEHLLGTTNNCDEYYKTWKL